jgi:hypothetical protein
MLVDGFSQTRKNRMWILNEGHLGQKGTKGLWFWFLMHACDRECGGD